MDIASPGKDIFGGIFFGFLLLGPVTVSLEPERPVHFDVLALGAFILAFGFGLSSDLGVGFGSRYDRDFTDTALLATIASSALCISGKNLPSGLFQRFIALRAGTQIAILCAVLPIGAITIWYARSLAAGSTGPLPTLVALVLGGISGFAAGHGVGLVLRPMLVLLRSQLAGPWQLVRQVRRPVLAFLLAYAGFAFVFASFYTAAYWHDPAHMFDFPEKANGTAHGFGDFFYYSLVTITTVGYGDIQPTHWISKTLASTEAILGVTWIAVFLAFLLKYLDLTDKPPART